MGSLEINRHPIHPIACLFEKHVAKSANKRKIAKVCDRTRLCLDAGSTFDLAQVAWAEFTEAKYRFCMTRRR
jgi:hypothetical protein